MCELNEIIARAVGHTKANENCPFCPPKARKGYKTFKGSANNSGRLTKIMENPGCLCDKQNGARPQTSAIEDGWSIEQDKPEARNYNKSKFYSFQAHHLISGKQALDGEQIEDWIIASGKNEKPTGYSVNYTKNGFWAPSVSKKFIGKWEPSKGLTDEQRQQFAEEIMKDCKAQIHIGPHNITDRDDPKGHDHTSYDRYLKKKLNEMIDRIKTWATKCACESDPDKMPKQVTHQLHNNFDNLSTHMIGKVTGSKNKWKIFLSKYAMEYQKLSGAKAK